MNLFRPESYRILIIDDARSFAEGVRTVLSEAGFTALTAYSGESALDLIRETGLPHLALVDINMPPGMDGFQFCEIVHQFSDVPVIMLTAIGEEDAIVHGIEKHAEDYVTKPFDSHELVARIGRVLRRIGDFAVPLDPRQKIDGYLSVNFPDGMVTIDGTVVKLTRTEAKLLYILMRSANEPVSVGFALRRLWPLEAPNEVRLRVYVHRLRHKLEKTELKHRYIVSKRGVGYIFVPFPSDQAGVAE